MNDREQHMEQMCPMMKHMQYPTSPYTGYDMGMNPCMNPYMMSPYMMNPCMMCPAYQMMGMMYPQMMYPMSPGMMGPGMMGQGTPYLNPTQTEE